MRDILPHIIIKHIKNEIESESEMKRERKS